MKVWLTVVFATILKYFSDLSSSLKRENYLSFEKEMLNRRKMPSIKKKFGLDITKGKAINLS